MKKICVTLLVAAAVMSMGSCGSQSQKVPFDNGDSTLTALQDPTIYGICGSGTTMNVLQMITDTGDTLSFDIETAQQEGKVFGGLQAGDQLAVMPDGNDSTIILVVNQSSLLGNWVMLNPIDGSDKVGITIKEGGVAESINQPTVSYRTWRLVNGRLELTMLLDNGTDTEEAVLYDFVRLGSDSLVIRDEEDTYEYSRLTGSLNSSGSVLLNETSGTDDIGF